MAETMYDDGRAKATATGAGWGWMLAYGILSVVLGATAFLLPYAATFAAVLAIGAFFVASGIVSIGAGIVGRTHEGRGYAIGFGIVSIVIGLILAFETAIGALTLTLLVTIWLAVRGVMEIIWGIRMRRGKAMMVALGVINLLLAGFVFVTLPYSALTLPGFILGLSFLFGGITAIASALAHRKGASAFAVPG